MYHYCIAFFNLYCIVLSTGFTVIKLYYVSIFKNTFLFLILQNIETYIFCFMLWQNLVCVCENLVSVQTEAPYPHPSITRKCKAHERAVVKTMLFVSVQTPRPKQIETRVQGGAVERSVLPLFIIQPTDLLTQNGASLKK